MAVTLRELLVRIDANTTGLKKGLNDGEKQLNRFSGIAQNVGRTMLGIFAVDRVFRYGKAIVQTTAEFEKLETVLTSTLGSSSMAQKSFELIAKFAAKTPFSVQEVTQSFVKLANRGVVPAYHQLERMADVASVLGKPFEQLVEAILDVSNSKRWTELGIKAENAGDKVRLTFRGVTQEVERTEAGVLGAIESFGNMQGVFGVTAKVAETAAGKLGELGDNSLMLQKNLGDSQSGLIHGFLTLANRALGDVNKALETTNKLTKDLDLAKLSEDLQPSFFQKILAAGAGAGSYGSLMANSSSEIAKEFNKVEKEVKDVFSSINQNGKLLAAPGDSIQQLEEKLAALNKGLESKMFYKYADFLNKIAEPAIVDINKAITEQTKALEKDKESQEAAAEAAKTRYTKEIELAKQLWTIEKEARASEKQEDFVMPVLDGGMSKMESDLLKVADGFQAIADQNAMTSINDDLEKTNKLLADEEKALLKTQEATEYWGTTLTNVFEAMITDGANAFDILIDAVKKLLIRLAAAAAATALISAFTGGAGGAVLSKAGGFGGLFSRLAGVPAFAEGGLVSGPTLGLVGEGAGTSRSNPEVIAPLSDLKNMMGGMMGGQLVAKVSGSDLLFILERAQRDYNR